MDAAVGAVDFGFGVDAQLSNWALEGDELRYTVTFTNHTEDAVAPNSIVITNPIPESTEYVEGSAFGAGSEAS